MVMPGFYTLGRHAHTKVNYMPVDHMPNYGPSVTISVFKYSFVTILDWTGPLVPDTQGMELL